MNHQNPTPPEQDGIVFGYAKACMSALKEAASAATTERFISLATRQIEESGQPATPERVAAHLHATLQALTATTEQLKTSK